MQISDLLEWGLKSAESTKEFDTLRGWLAQAIILAAAQVAPGSDKGPLDKHFADLTSDEASRLCSALPSRAGGEIYSRIEELRRAQASREANAPDIHNGLSALLDKLDGTNRKRRQWSGSLKVLKVAAYIGPILLAYLLGVFFRFYKNLVWDSDAVLSPPATYALRSENYEVTEDYRTRFFKEFSRYYFHRDNAFAEQFVRGRIKVLTSAEEGREASNPAKQPASQFFESPTESDVGLNLGALKVRVVFRNPRRAEPFLVSAIETTATYRAKPFDWSRVEVGADLDVKVYPSAVSISDKGIGPATDVKYRVTAGGMILYERSTKYILNDTETWELSYANGDVVSLKTKSDTSPMFEQPVYWLLHGEDATKSFSTSQGDPFRISQTLLTCNDGRQFEIVSGAERLAQLTKTIRGGPADVDIAFESLRRERASKRVAVKLPDDRVFAEGANSKISERNPCLPPPPAPPPPPPPPAVARFIDNLAGGASSLKGVDLIKASSRIDLLHLPDGGTVGVVASPDEILNPAGFVMLDLTIANGRNGELDLQFKVNSVKLREMKMQLLVPDDTHFEPVTVEKMRHFRDEKD
jgi:hypothetical protein